MEGQWKDNGRTLEGDWKVNNGQQLSTTPTNYIVHELSELNELRWGVWEVCPSIIMSQGVGFQALNSAAKVLIYSGYVEFHRICNFSE